MNIIEIARLAGVSKSTVSRYLNEGYVSDESRDKIQKVMDETGFVPKRHAQSMRTNKSHLIAVIVPKISTETASAVIEGITAKIAEEGYELIIANTNLSTEKEKDYLNLFKTNYVDGIIFMATQLDDDHLRLMEQLEVPIVVAAQKVEGYSYVTNANYEAAKEAVSYIISNHHHRIGFIGVSEDDEAVGIDRKKGYLDALKEANIKKEDQLITMGDFSIESGNKLAQQLMSQENKPTAIFAATDHLAIGAIDYLKSAGYDVPKDVAVMGIGDSRISSFVTPKLTTISYPYHELGMTCADVLLDSMKQPIQESKKNVSHFILGYRLIERDSV
ncbi:MAG TPA: LacI family transcriptional regulator [Firmicutes bacterium]|nr:LacI family transcriptional regulator [Bacillota bacterium]